MIIGQCFSFQPSTMPAASQMLRTVAQHSMVSGMGGHQLSSQMHPMMAQRLVTQEVDTAELRVD